MAKVSKGMLIKDILEVDNGVIPILLGAGMHCFGCPSAPAETLEEAGKAHQMQDDEIDTLVDSINNYLVTVS